MDLKLNQRVELKKQHPCGSKVWTVLRVGMDIKLRCAGCGHELMLPRSKAEKAIKKNPERGGKDMSQKWVKIISRAIIGLLVAVMLIGLILPVFTA